MGETKFTPRITSQHSRDLGNSRLIFHRVCVGSGNSRARALGYHYVVVGPGRDLRQMGNGEYLMMSCQCTHGIAYLQANATAYAGIHLVEYECGRMIEARDDGLEREHYTGQLTT
jgi:hypothetical protein